MLDQAASSWLLRSRPKDGARLRLFCFPYAGGAAVAYRGWSDRLPGGVEVCPVQLPGRGNRFREPAFERIDALVRAAADGLAPHLDRPFAFFGHSMGALVAFELARELRRRGQALPFGLLVSAHEAPHRPAPLPPITHLGDAEFVDEVRRRYGGIPDEVLAEPELLEIMLPVLRSDITALEGHRHSPEPPLGCPLSCFAGVSDPHLGLEDLEGWREHTGAAFRLRRLPGGHFFLNPEESQEALLSALAEDLAAWRGAP
jgi:surfactin synthase thioesterase subunit